MSLFLLSYPVLQVLLSGSIDAERMDRPNRMEDRVTLHSRYCANHWDRAIPWTSWLVSMDICEILFLLMFGCAWWLARSWPRSCWSWAYPFELISSKLVMWFEVLAHSQRNSHWWKDGLRGEGMPCPPTKTAGSRCLRAPIIPPK